MIFGTIAVPITFGAALLWSWVMGRLASRAGVDREHSRVARPGTWPLVTMAAHGRLATLQRDPEAESKQGDAGEPEQPALSTRASKHAGRARSQSGNDEKDHEAEQRMDPRTGTVGGAADHPRAA